MNAGGMLPDKFLGPWLFQQSDPLFLPTSLWNMSGSKGLATAGRRNRKHFQYFLEIMKGQVWMRRVVLACLKHFFGQCSASEASETEPDHSDLAKKFNGSRRWSVWHCKTTAEVARQLWEVWQICLHGQHVSVRGCLEAVSVKHVPGSSEEWRTFVGGSQAEVWSIESKAMAKRLLKEVCVWQVNCIKGWGGFEKARPILQCKPNLLEAMLYYTTAS